MQQERLDLFSDLVNVITLTGTQVGELLCTHERSFGSQIEGHIHRLEQEIVQLHWKGEELKRLADMQDHIRFLKVVERQMVRCITDLVFADFLQMTDCCFGQV